MRSLVVAMALACAGTSAWAQGTVQGQAQSTVPAAQPAPLAPPPPPGAGTPDIRAQISPRQHTVLSSELGGKIVELAVREGDSFKKGDRLVAFDCAIHKAKLEHSDAAELAARKKLDVAAKLDKLNSISGMEVAQTEAALAMARAESSMNRTLVQRCAINAPFDGRVAEANVQRWEYVAEGKELLAIYDAGAYEVEMIVPSRWLAWLKPGQGFGLRIDENGREYKAEVTRLAARVDPISQSVKVFGRITGSQEGLLPGMSGTALLAPPASPPQAADAGR